MSKINEAQKKKYGSPTEQAKKLVPLSKKFSAYPVSDAKSTTNQPARNPEGSRNDVDGISVNSAPGISSV